MIFWIGDTSRTLPLCFWVLSKILLVKEFSRLKNQVCKAPVREKEAVLVLHDKRINLEALESHCWNLDYDNSQWFKAKGDVKKVLGIKLKIVVLILFLLKDY